MKVALAQVNTTVGDCRGNLEKVRDYLERGRAAGAELIVFPEATIPGYPAEDLLERGDFLDEIEETLAEAVEATKGTGVGIVLGTASRAEPGDGLPIYNSAVLIDDGEIVGWQHKTLLPTYDVFDEGRYFRPASEHRTFSFRGHEIAIGICEDLWNDPHFWQKRRYAVDPVERWLGPESGGKKDILISLSASPFSLGHPELRRRMFGAICERYDVELLFCNLVGGNTSLVFDGASIALARKGQVRAAGKSFEEDLVVVEVGRGLEGSSPVVHEGVLARYAADADLDAHDIEDAYNALVLGTRDYLGKSGFRSAVIGLSGGIDSALTAVIAADAIGEENVTGVAMPSRYSSEGSVTDADALAQALGVKMHTLPIEKIFAATLETLAPVFEDRPPDVAEENLQARTRGLLLMAISNKFGSILLTTGNKSELSVGYCTLYGDMSGGLAVISDVPKILVYEICRWINETRGREVVPWSTIEKPPSAELRPDQKDEDSLPPYEVLDEILERYVEDRQGVDGIATEGGFDRDLVVDIVRKVDMNEYKRKQAAPGLRITAKAFGHGRRFPIVKRLRR